MPVIRLQPFTQHFSGKGGTAGRFTVKYRRMCGICGVIGNQRSELAEEITRRMMGALTHRGPDEDGLLIAPSAALGMRRLSIKDLPGEHQPVFNEPGMSPLFSTVKSTTSRSCARRWRGAGMRS